MKAAYQQPNNPKRQKLLKPLPAIKHVSSLSAEKNTGDDGTINNIEDLKAALQNAIELEHSTIPPYLCALYSIKDGTNQKAVDVIRSIVVEEMLHMILACNILNAIGGEPKINKRDFVPTYPGHLPDSDNSFVINLEKFSRHTVDIFLKIEKPAHTDAPPKSKGYHTIGQFYQAVRIGLEFVNANTPGGIFTTDEKQRAKQITEEHYYGSGGQIIPVYTIDDARQAIAEIVGQGEGIDDTIEDSDQKMFGQGIEYAHYFRFNELHLEQLYQDTDTPKSGPTGDKIVVEWDAVHNMKRNPKAVDFEKYPELYEKVKSFNRTYTLLLDNIHNACNGQPDLLMKGVAMMYQLKYKAVELMNIPIPGTTYTAGPSFEFET
ncbi:ferritin-like protein [Mucilaginibacter sp. AW1-3]